MGNILWVTLFSLTGYFFGNIPVVRKNFTLAIMAIVFVSILPMLIAIIRKFWNQYKMRNNQ
jgi:membrane-associated protein